MKRFLELAFKRKTTYEFSQEPLKEEHLHKLVEAARWAPSIQNKQPWRLVIVRDKKKIELLMNTAFYGAFHTDPPCIIVLVIPEDSWADKTMDDEFSRSQAMLSVAMPALNIAYQAQDDGLASCFLTPLKDVKSIIDVRDHSLVPLMVGVGFADEKGYTPKRHRKPASQIVRHEQYGE